MKRIKFFSYYGCLDLGKRRKSSPAADTKIDYIVNVLNRLGYGVDIISRAPNSESHFVSAYVERKGINTYRYFASLGNTNFFLRLFDRFFLNIQFFLWSLFHLQKREQIIVYHSLGYDSIFIKLNYLKKIRIIGEVEEIYQDVKQQVRRVCYNEYRFIGICDKFIFPTHLLDQKLNVVHKPAVIIHGVYTIEPNVQEKFADGKIHVVYGGTLDPNKGGAIAAATAAEFLPENYHIHICGFGNPKQIITEIERIQKKTKAKVTFEGEFKGDDYKRFIQKCHIGLSTQDPSAAFNNTSFPSKVLVYLSNGLKVVSVRIPVIEESALVNQLVLYNKQTPKDIAEAILVASKSNIENNYVLRNLDKQFEENLLSLITR